MNESSKWRSVQLSEMFKINNSNLQLRKQFIRLSEEDVEILKQLKPWAEKYAEIIAYDFYEHQFSFPATLAFFKAHAQKKGKTLQSLREHLQKMQAAYFLQIFEEAEQGGDFGTNYFERRLKVGKIHNVINLPLKWYVGSYTLYQELVSKYLREAFPLRVNFWRKAEHAIFTVFNYDIQSVVDAFFYDYLQAVGLDLAAIDVREAREDLSEYYETLKNNVRLVIEETVRTSAELSATSRELASATQQVAEATNQIALTIQHLADGATLQAETAAKTANAVEQMTRSIQSVSEGAQEQAKATMQTMQAMDQLAISIEGIQEGAVEQAQRMEQVTEMGNILIEAISSVDEARNEVSQESQRALEAALSGSEIIAQTVSGMGKLRQATEQLADKVRHMGESSAKIGTVVETIKDIASQTNLLALNAAIEAARAGEHGKGFGVVAKEVYKLAESTAQATKEISDMIKAVQTDAEEAVHAMQRAGEDVAQAVKLTDQAGAAFETITAYTRTSSEKVEIIREAIQAVRSAYTQMDEVLKEVAAITERNKQAAVEMGNMSRIVVDSMDRVSSVTEQNTEAMKAMTESANAVSSSVENTASISEENSASAEQMSASTEEMSAQMVELSITAQRLKEMALRLQEIVAKFKLEGT